MPQTRIIQEFKAVRQRRLNGETAYPRIDLSGNLAAQFNHSIQLIKTKNNLQHLLLYFDYGEHATHTAQEFGRNRHMIRSIYKIFKHDPQSLLHIRNITNEELKKTTIKEWKRISQKTALEPEDPLDNPRAFNVE